MATKTAELDSSTKVVSLASLKRDQVREEKGDWIESDSIPGVSYNVSSLNKTAFVNARDLMYQRLNKVYRRKPIPQEVLRVELGKLYHIHILHDWKGLDVPYTPELGLTVLTDAGYRAVLADVESAAARVADIDIEFVEAALGN
ncbi:hypothetical protein [Rhizobium sp. SG570]|uniref:hypothetical protein n=1 Tax=Rhizobium sp. SG570 TaxID=2587113 RepID=UPI001446472D|nr:hypothetical protein [Rhizobium sp. SG570]NKJ34109.1 hypothetical protein [Rhizobium sp. SG570]